MGLTTMRVPLSKIEVGHGLWHVRVHFRQAGRSRLKRSLATEGQRDPILVRAPEREGRPFQLVTGRRRLEVARELGWFDILVRSVSGTDAEMATLALGAELGDQEGMTPLERGWAAATTKALRRSAGLPSSVRELAKSCNSTKSTVQHAVTIGEAFPRKTVEGLSRRMGVSLEDVLAIRQAPLLEIARAPSGRHDELLSIAIKAHLHGKSAKAAIDEQLGRPAPAGVNSVRQSRDGRFSLRMDRPPSDLTRPELEGLASELANAASALAKEARARPTPVQSVQQLDKGGSVHGLTKWLLEWFRRCIAALLRPVV